MTQDLFIGIVAGAALGMLLLCLIPNSNYNMVHKALTECEKTLPRSQTCVIIAVPKEIK